MEETIQNWKFTVKPEGKFYGSSPNDYSPPPQQRHVLMAIELLQKIEELSAGMLDKMKLVHVSISWFLDCPEYAFVFELPEEKKIQIDASRGWVLGIEQDARSILQKLLLELLGYFKTRREECDIQLMNINKALSSIL